MTVEPEPNSQGYLPIISDQTSQQLIEELGLIDSKHIQELKDVIVHVDPKNQDITAIAGRIPSMEISTESPYERLRIFTRNLFEDLFDSNPSLIQTIQQGVFEGLVYGQQDINYRNSCFLGMAVILRAFQIESGYNLINNLSSINPEEGDRIKEICIRSLGGAKSAPRDILQEILNAPKLPFLQINLKRVVHTVSQLDRLNSSRIRSGALVMYTILSELYTRSTRPVNPQQTKPPEEIS